MYKKLLSVLLALVMILSVLPMAAFAEETEHTHDENCGCASVLMVCEHPTYSSGEQFPGYESIDGTYHYLHTYEPRFCSICGATFYVIVETALRWHIPVGGRTYIGTQMVDGELKYVYESTCVCGTIFYEYLDSEI